MKRLFTIVCLLVSAMGRGQCSWGGWEFIDFDADTCYRNLFVIDTVNYHHNVWQIGSPQKVVFDSAFFISLPNAIVTDTLNTFPSDDTSVFIIKVPTKNPLCWNPSSTIASLAFDYQLDIDSNIEATLELSLDSGTHWLNMLDTLPFTFTWEQAPNLTGSSNGWRHCKLATIVYSPDTILLRFTIMSNSIVTLKDGWIMDHFEVQFWCEGAVPLLQNPNLITLYPNPSHGNIYIHTDRPHKDATIAVHDMQGRQVYSDAAPANGYLNLQLPNGIYTLKYSDEEEYSVKQVVIQN